MMMWSHLTGMFYSYTLNTIDSRASQAIRVTGNRLRVSQARLTDCAQAFAVNSPVYDIEYFRSSQLVWVVINRPDMPVYLVWFIVRTMGA